VNWGKAFAAVGADASYFLTFHEGKRRAINPYEWIDKTIINHRLEPEQKPIIRTAEPVSLQWKDDPKLRRILQLIEAEKSERRQVNYEERVEAAISRWLGQTTGTGNSEFFMLAVALTNAGMGRTEIQRTLFSESAHAHGAESQRDRKAAIPAIMDRLRCAA
jgi:hypothetical protein